MNKKISAIITDVDGVMVGKKKGINFPLPHATVVQALQEVGKKIPIILCTAKAMYGITGIIEMAHLANPHISNAGALISDPLDDKLIARHILPKGLALEIATYALEKDIFIELHTDSNFIIQSNQNNHLAHGHAEIMQKDPQVVENLLDFIKNNEVIKIFMVVESKENMPIVDALINKLGRRINHVWTHHPTMFPAQFAVITNANVSKKDASEEVLKSLGISLHETLGIGDTLGDWNFMQLCKYVAVIGDHDTKLSEIAKTKGEGNYFLAPSVDDHGILETFKFFGLS